VNTVLDGELSEVIGRVLGEPTEIVRVRPHPFQSSCALAEISASGPSGERRELLLKDLSRRSRHPGPARLYDERREVAVYRRLAREQGLDMPRLVGSDIDPGRDRYWLLIEQVEGIPLWQSSDPAAWREAAAWLAKLHELDKRPDGCPWLRYDAEYYALWMPRAMAFAPHADLAALEDVHARAVQRLTGAPAVVVHGDYYPSNVLVRADRPPSVCPVDFELAGIGPTALDLAALTSGLGEELSTAVEDAYRARRRVTPERDELRLLVLCARLHLAIRWLGWMPGWEPPEHQRFDWAAEARAAAAALGATGWR
jgi:aminoglycoside phosphotransferase (APT) family kinase protein